MLKWLRRSMGGSKAGMASVVGAVDQVVNPGAARATELLKEQNERVMPVPSPGDRLLAEGKVTITREPADDPELPADRARIFVGCGVAAWECLRRVRRSTGRERVGGATVWRPQESAP